MSAALRLFDPMTSSSSLRPTLAPANDTVPPTTRSTELPATQRSADAPSQVVVEPRTEVQKMLSVMKLNAEFLRSLVTTGMPSSAQEALRDLEQDIERLEKLFAIQDIRPAR